MNKPDDKLEKLLRASLTGDHPDPHFLRSLRNQLRAHFKTEAPIPSHFWRAVAIFVGAAALLLLIWIGFRTLEGLQNKASTARDAINAVSYPATPGTPSYNTQGELVTPTPDRLASPTYPSLEISPDAGITQTPANLDEISEERSNVPLPVDTSDLIAPEQYDTILRHSTDIPVDNPLVLPEGWSVETVSYFDEPAPANFISGMPGRQQIWRLSEGGKVSSSVLLTWNQAGFRTGLRVWNGYVLWEDNGISRETLPFENKLYPSELHFFVGWRDYPLFEIYQEKDPSGDLYHIRYQQDIDPSADNEYDYTLDELLIRVDDYRMIYKAGYGISADGKVTMRYEEDRRPGFQLIDAPPDEVMYYLNELNAQPTISPGINQQPLQTPIPTYSHVQTPTPAPNASLLVSPGLD
ncbi:MAG TPA: hypothetical protein PKD55_14925 [Bellilinea sp.]|nr:hypothetical protein [Bellilinea sp.]